MIVEYLPTLPYLPLPRFDFRCLECALTFETLLLPGEAPKPCTNCGSRNLEKLLSPPPIIFKGAGFYRTDSTKTLPPKSKETAEAKEDLKPEAKKGDAGGPLSPLAPESTPKGKPEKELAPRPRDT